MRNVYLDNNATTPVDPEVFEAMKPHLTGRYANPASLHSLGRAEAVAVETAREQTARLINAEPSEIVFTASGTEADNHAIKATCEQLKGRRDHIVITTIEHPAVASTCGFVVSKGWDITLVPVSQEGLIDLDGLEDALTEKTALVSIILANNEVGTIQPVREAAEIAHRVGALMHTDAVQACGKVPVDVKQLGVDLLALSGHKIYGPKGVGAIYIRDGVKLPPLLHGGGHENGRRSSTLNVPCIAGLGKAAELALSHLTDYTTRVGRLRDKLEKGILARISHTHINGSREKRLPNTTNISFDFVEGEAILLRLDAKGVYVSTGSACASGKTGPSSVLKAMNIGDERIHSAIRFSLGRQLVEEEIDYALNAIEQVITTLREMSPLTPKGL